MIIRVITAADDLDQLVSDINRVPWDEENALPIFDSASLTDYINHPGTLFIACFDQDGADRSLLGMASSRFELKPYAKKLWLYVDEVDVSPDHRRRGVGRALMLKAIEVAREAGCKEVWLGTEGDNTAAQALYESLDPTDISPVWGYTYVLPE